MEWPFTAFNDCYMPESSYFLIELQQVGARVNRFSNY